jgi:hypothetical protein
MRRLAVSDLYFEAVDALAGGIGTRYEVSEPKEVSPVLVAIYSDVPETGHTTSFTFGLSSADHPEWVQGRPELIVSVKSLDHSWGLCIGDIVRNHRSKDLFSQGTMLHFRQRIADDSRMTSFLVYACTLLDQTDQRIVLPDRVVGLSQAYPIYEEEAELVKRMGVRSFFWDLGVDFYDVTRRSTAELPAC